MTVTLLGAVARLEHALDGSMGNASVIASGSTMRGGALPPSIAPGGEFSPANLPTSAASSRRSKGRWRRRRFPGAGRRLARRDAQLFDQLGMPIEQTQQLAGWTAGSTSPRSYLSKAVRP